MRAKEAAPRLSGLDDKSPEDQPLYSETPEIFNSDNLHTDVVV